MSRRCGSLLLAALLSLCRAAVLPSNDISLLPPENDTALVPLDSILISISRSPELPDEPASIIDAEQETQFGPFGQILELGTRGPGSSRATDVIVDTEPLTPRDFRLAERLNNELPPEGVNDPIIQEAYYEGDIIMLHSDFVALNEDNAAIQTKLWPGGQIYYTLSRAFTGREKSVIASAVKEFEKRTCLRLVPLPPGPTNQDYVYVTKGSGCFSSVGRMGTGRQELSLGTGCVYKGIVLHEFMHAAGFWHEQSRPDRDNYVAVHYDNIRPVMRSNFKKYTWATIPNLGLSYDVGSIMHYGPYAFARDKSRPTLTNVTDIGTTRMGQREGFSSLDVQKLNRLYSCGSSTTTPTTPTTPTPTTPTPTTTTQPGTCRDDNKNCEFWAGIGECSRNVKYMHKFCKYSCRICTGSTCRDMNRECSIWAQSGECGKNPSYMTVYCRPSCGLCSPQLAQCKDNDQNCPGWARVGECERNPRYMNVNCKLSCHRC